MKSLDPRKDLKGLYYDLDTAIYAIDACLRCDDFDELKDTLRKASKCATAAQTEVRIAFEKLDAEGAENE